MQRVLVMGSSGSGKSTFARRLSGLTGISIVSIDGLFCPTLLAYFQGLRADQSLLCFTDRARADGYLNDLALEQNRASIH
ncbi:hypothetical protein [Bradyrhizobium genosp. P]|uniref:hypothetical protein n=1 Tax=Bradyrhizobium genosp. P TaxID=83641 RepID=UPI003CF0EABC